MQVGIPGFDDEQRRVIAATINGVRIVNLYVVNGQDVGTEKYEYKLRWLEAVHDWLHEELRAHPKLVVLGDFNIAPDDRDVHDPAVWNDGHILTSTAERAALRRLLRARPARSLPPAPRRGRHVQLVGLPRAAFRRNLGLRIDLTLVSDALRAARRRHRPGAAHLGASERPCAGVGELGGRRPEGSRARDERAARDATLKRTKARRSRAFAIPRNLRCDLAHAAAAEQVDDGQQDDRADQRRPRNSSR